MLLKLVYEENSLGVFFEEQLFRSLLFVISVATTLYFLLKFSPQVKAFPILAGINPNPKLYWIGCNQSKYVGWGVCLDWLSPLEKPSASLGMCKVTSGVAWCPVSHICVN